MSTRSEIYRIRDITELEMTRLISICVRAYAKEPSIPPMLGGREDLRGLLFRAMIGAGALEGDLYVLENENRQIVSMALWYGRGRSMWSTEEQRKEGYYKLMGKLDDDTKAWWKQAFGSDSPLSDLMEKKLGLKSSEDCWWLSLLATDPNHQGSGYATQLVNTMLDEVSHSNIAALSTTTEENEGYYKHLGFQTKGQTVTRSKFGDFPAYLLARSANVE